jgi:hypothetical protein
MRGVEITLVTLCFLLASTGIDEPGAQTPGFFLAPRGIQCASCQIHSPPGKEGGGGRGERAGGVGGAVGKVRNGGVGESGCSWCAHHMHIWGWRDGGKGEKGG